MDSIKSLPARLPDEEALLSPAVLCYDELFPYGVKLTGGSLSLQNVYNKVHEAIKKLLTAGSSPDYPDNSNLRPVINYLTNT